MLFLSAAHPEDGRGLLAREEAEEGRGRFLTAEEGGGAGRGGVPAPVRVFAGDLPGPGPWPRPAANMDRPGTCHPHPRELEETDLGPRTKTEFIFGTTLPPTCCREVHLVKNGIFRAASCQCSTELCAESLQFSKLLFVQFNRSLTFFICFCQ